MSTTAAQRTGFGQLLRRWRTARGLSQLKLSADTGVSSRHLSFLETGRAQPSRQIILFLAEQLDVPLPDRNDLLLAAGFAPAYGSRSLDDPAMAGVRDSITHMLAGHEPYPALVMDGGWNRLLANQGTRALVPNVAPFLLAEPVNVLRLTLHPEGMAPRIVNLAEWSEHLLLRLRQRIKLRRAERNAGIDVAVNVASGGGRQACLVARIGAIARDAHFSALDAKGIVECGGRTRAGHRDGARRQQAK